MRLISMERDGNRAAVYERLVKVVQEIEKKLEFLRHRRLELPYILPYESWHSHPSPNARSLAKIERGLSTIQRDRHTIFR